MPYKLILASSSPRRVELLRSAGLSFEVINPASEEALLENEPPAAFASRVSFEKAASVSSSLDDGYIVIGADTIVVVDGQILGKPSGESEAAHMLHMLSGREHSVMTAFSIVKPKSELLHAEIVETRVRVKRLAASEIEGYIKTGEPMDKAGAYGIQGVGSFIVEGITGSYTNVVGLPVPELLGALSGLGITGLIGSDGSGN